MTGEDISRKACPEPAEGGAKAAKKTDSPRTSVLITSFNYAEYLPAAITSVLHQTDPDFELLVVDDGSTDDSRAVVHACADPRVRLLVQPHRGRGAARNTGMRAAAGRYIAFLDADDIWVADKLARQCAILDGCADVGIVYSRYGVIDADGRVQSQGRSYFSPKPSGAILRHLLTGNVIGTPSTICFRRRLIEDQDVVVDETGTYREDWHFFLLLAARCRVHYLPRTLAYHRQHRRNAQGNVSAGLAESRCTAQFGLKLARERFGFTEHEVKRVERRVLAYIEAVAGHEFIKVGDWARARAHEARSLRHYPWNVVEIALFLMTSVGWVPRVITQHLK
jgi:glycosyltransferase involved in cell wall biosynthesis